MTVSMTSYFIIANPAAGHGECEKVIPQVKNAPERHGATFQLVQSKESWHGFELAREAVAEFDVVVALGGDGTANEVINGLMTAMKEGVGTAVLGGTKWCTHCPSLKCRVNRSGTVAVSP